MEYYKLKYLKYKMKYNILNTNKQSPVIGGKAWFSNQVSHSKKKSPKQELEQHLYPKVTLYAEDHYDAPPQWKQFVIDEMEKYDFIIIEEEIFIPVNDKDFIPQVNLEYNESTDNSAIGELQRTVESKKVESDVRSLLDIPIDSSLVDILINLFASFVGDPSLNGIMELIIHFLEVKFIRNLLNPSTTYINLIANLKEKLTNDEYNYIKELYHKTINKLKLDTDSIINTLSNMPEQNINPGEMITEFGKQIDILMFKMPALLNDIYVTALIMSNKEHNLMVIYGAAHIYNINKILNDFYKIHFKIFDSIHDSK